MQKIIVSIGGMHCRSCEILVEEKLSEISKIKKIEVNHKKGEAEIFYDSQKPSMMEIENAIRESGYTIGVIEKKPLFSKNVSDYKDLGIAFLFLFGIYIVAKNLGLTDIGIGNTSNPSSLGVVFLVGITAGISTCMALVGGLILGISARHSEKNPEATPAQKFRPHLFFNAGRIAIYALLGGVLGLIGSSFQLSGMTLGILTITVGIVMLILGLKLIGIFPRLENGGITLPKSISSALGIKKSTKEYSHKNSFLMGGLTFFLPCGFTQAMQLYAVSSGSFTQGALIMGIFALGTAPGLLGVGGLASVVRGIFAKRFFKFSGILVIFLAIFNMANGYNLTGWQLLTNNSQPTTSNLPTGQAGKQNDPNVTMENGVQVVRMKEIASGYSPNKFTIKKGVPVKWIIDAQAPYSCASSLVVSSLKIQKTLKASENIIEFTPKETGKIPFSCSMGMYTGLFNVVDENGGSEIVEEISDKDKTPNGICNMQGCTINKDQTK
ncbi:MAG: heavy metal transport/detoxification protein [Candidatus Moranbacteria bacterium GW2011_GWD2_36_12]|nr:MAG: heavy metal transport/detoxification protein [Candidatus Moranbacteria bacterium GW2011_GWD2_36_12]KKQ07148.1 MAG: heavy metal transport/detoxification protein [Candidatus Moranbacteria bacterium GW2011_GWE2_36_40]